MKQQYRIEKNFIVPLCVLFLLVQTASICGLFHVSFWAIEKYVIKKNLQFCTSAIHAELKRIDSITYEWSAWDDTALFIQGKKPEFVRDNLFSSALQKKNLDVLCILDLQGKPVWGRAVKTYGEESRDIELLMFAPETLQKNVVLWNHKDPDSCISGYYPTEGGVLMLSSRPVTNNTNTAPIHGTIIMGRFVSDQVITSAARQTCLDFKWWNLRSEYTKQAMAEYVSRITNEHPVFIELDASALTAYTILPGIQNEKAILLKLLLANELAPYKSRFMATSIIIYFIEGFLFLACLKIIVNKQRKADCARTEQTVTPITAAYPAFEHTPDSPDAAPRESIAFAEHE